MREIVRVNEGNIEGERGAMREMRAKREMRVNEVNEDA